MNTAERRQPSNELRKGVAPFAPERPTKTLEHTDYTSRIFGPIPFGSLGQADMHLMKPPTGALERVISKDEQGFTIDLSGKIYRGNLRDLINAGYYPLAICFLSNTETKQQLTVNIWIDQADPIFSADIDHYDTISISPFTRINEGVKESFVLPDDPEILQAVRINVSSKKETPVA